MGDAITTEKRHKQLASVLSLWNGLFPALLLSSNPAIQYTAYDALKSTLLRRLKHGKLSMWESFACGIVAKFCATIVTYPLIRCKVLLMVAPPAPRAGEDDGTETPQKGSSEAGLRGAVNGRLRTSGRPRSPVRQRRPPSSRDTKTRHPRSLPPLLVHIFCSEGLRGLYRGCSMQLLHTLMKSALMMMVRERITSATYRFFRVEGETGAA